MRRNWRRTMRVFHETYGDGPWACRECGGIIDSLGRTKGCGNVHHLDHDMTNDEPGNLAVSHVECHQRHHHTGVPKSLEHRAKTGRKGRIFTDEWRAKLTQRQLQRVKCPHCDYVHTPQFVGRHKKSEHKDGITCV